MNIRQRLGEAAPLLMQIALGDRAPPTSAILTSDGRAGRYTPHGLEWVEIVPSGEVEAAFRVAKELAAGRESFSARDDDGTTLSGFVTSRGDGQLKLALAPGRRYAARDFAESLPAELFAYLEALVRIGEPLWILGDTGFEFELGVALAPADHTLIVRPPSDHPAPHRAASLGSSVTLEAALQQLDLAGFNTLVFAGALEPEVIDLVAHRSGFVLTQRGTAVERVLRQAGILQRQESAAQLLSLGAIVVLARSASGGAIVSEVAEFRAGASSIEYAVIARRGVGPDPTALVTLATPQGLAKIAAAGVHIEGEAFTSAAASDDGVDVALDDDLPDPDARDEEEASLFSEAEAVSERRSVRRPDAIEDEDDELHEDPGWELDAAAGTSARTGLVQAPGEEGRSGMFRPRPVVRPSAPAGKNGDEDDELGLGTLTLDAPRRRVIIPEAPSGSAAKRSFAEILKERHRFPPVSENGPTLTPPVLRNANGTFDTDDDDQETDDDSDDVPLGDRDDDITP